MSENTDKLYRRMCLKADELQKKLHHKGLSVGSKIVLKDGKEGIVVYVNSWDGSFHIATYSKQWGWTGEEKRRTPDDGYWHIFSLDQLWAWWEEVSKAHEDPNSAELALHSLHLYYFNDESGEIELIKGDLRIGLLCAIYASVEYQKRWDSNKEAWVAVKEGD